MSGSWVTPRYDGSVRPLAGIAQAVASQWIGIEEPARQRAQPIQPSSEANIFSNYDDSRGIGYGCRFAERGQSRHDRRLLVERSIADDSNRFTPVAACCDQLCRDHAGMFARHIEHDGGGALGEREPNEIGRHTACAASR